MAQQPQNESGGYSDNSMGQSDDEHAPLVENGNQSEEMEEGLDKPSFPCIPKHYCLSLVMLIAFTVAYAMRFNLNLALATIAGHRNISNFHHANETVMIDRTFNTSPYMWEPKLQGFALSAFFFGYAAMQIPGAWLAFKYGGFTLLALSLLLSGIITLLEPLIIAENYTGFVICRVVIGIVQGPIYPAMIEFWKEWSHTHDRSRMTSTTEVGASVGIIFSMLLSHIIIVRLGWSSPFYIYGLIAIAWTILWMISASRWPATCYRSKTKEEMPVPKKQNIPWKTLFTSLPIYAYSIAFFCEGWILFTSITHIPKFLKLRHHYEIRNVGMFATVPFIGQVIMLLLSSFISDFLIAKNYLNTTTVRKGFYVTGSLISAIALAVVGFLQNSLLAIICLFIAIIIDGATRCVLLVNPLDLALPHAGIVMGIGHTAGNIAGCICPIMAAYIEASMAINRWRFIFGITAGISLLGAIAFLVGGSGESIEKTDQKSELEK